jgi:tetratricopeptide (TPR) repeat protein
MHAMNEDLPNEAVLEPASGVPGDPPSGLSTERLKLRTPPPESMGHEGPRSAASLALKRYELDMPVPHRVGPRAELATLSARLTAASAAGEEERERVAASAFSRALAARGTELELATRYARRSLLIGDDPVLREELAGWFASLGEPSLAAITLRPLLNGKTGPDAAALHLRVAVLLGRAGDAEGQRDALTQAAAENPAESQAVELLGAIGAWAPQVMSGPAAAHAYLEAAERRDRLGERSSAFENLLRAYEMAPELAPAANRLAHVLTLRSRSGAADEVYREHARALGEQGRQVQLQRMQSAIGEGDWPRALGAAFDAGCDAEVDLKSVLVAIERKDVAPAVNELGFDELLERAGLHELFAARLELTCDGLAGRERAAVGLALGRLYAGPLGRPDRAVEAWIEALVFEPGNAEAKSLLRNHASTSRDHAPLLEALIRIGETGATPERNASLRELATLAEERLSDPALASWALTRLLETEADDVARQALEHLQPRVNAQSEALRTAEAELLGTTGADRAPLLASVASLLQGHPNLADRSRAVLAELCQLVPADRGLQCALERILVRKGRLTEWEAELERLSERATSEPERGRLGLLRSHVRRRRGDVQGALTELTSLIEAPGSHAAAWSLALLLARAGGAKALHARALLRLAAQLAPPFRAILSSVAAEELLDCGDLALARTAADQACHADPSLARPVAARARVGLLTGDRWGAEAMERAMGVIVPRAELCRALARTYEALSEPLLSMAFTQRLIALRPGDLEAARIRLEHVTRAADGSRLADALAWLFSQPEPLGSLSELIDVALRTLAELDPARAGGLARRALDVIGPRSPALRQAVLAVADLTFERGLGIAAIERFLAAGAAGDERTDLLLDLARRRRTAGDADGSARALLRALREGAKAQLVQSELDQALPTKSSDGEIAILEARAEALSGSVDADHAGTALAWREVGAAYFDLAGDMPRAVRAWERAAALNPERGVECFASDLVAFAGADAALVALRDLAVRRPKPKDTARVLAIASTVALFAGKQEDAFRIACQALELDPSRTDVLAVAERAATDEQVPALEKLYLHVSDAALGPYGERAVHYRAARQLEKRNMTDLALAHAVRAFEAVPSEGVAFVIMARLAERSAQSSEVVRAIERVALKHATPEARAGWLRRAALFAGSSEEGKRQRVEVLLRALSVRPEVELVQALSESLRALLLVSIDDRETLELRFDKAISSLLPKMDGPEGARISIACAIAALETFGSGQVAVSALSRAVQCDGDLEEFTQLFPYAGSLAAVGAGGSALVRSLVDLAAQKFGGAGPTVLDLGARLATALGDQHSEARLLVAAAKKEPENASLVRRAEASARSLGDPELLEAVLDVIPVGDRVGALLAIADAADAVHDPEQAILALGRARAIEGLSDVARRGIFDRLCDVLRRTDRRDDLELALEAELGDGDLDPDTRARLTAELAALIGARGDPEGALQLFRQLLLDHPADPVILGGIAALLRQTGDAARQAEVLGQLADATREPAARLSLLRQVASLLSELGEDGAALTRWKEVLELDPNDSFALSVMERELENSGDYEGLIALLLHRASLAGVVDDMRRIRLQRATVLEQRLGRADEARVELEALTAATGDNLSVLRVLADLHERLGAPLRSAPLWLRASAIAQDRAEAADLSRRGCEAYLAGGDFDSARRVLEGMGAWAQSPKLLELAVEVERRRGNPRALAEALDELATASTGSAQERADWLVEGARAWLAGGKADLALSLATRAARVAPESATAQLLARELEYRSQGTGDAADARVTVAELRRIRPPLTPEQNELCAFLLSEALDVAAGIGAGEAELERASHELGERPLIALGLAERRAERAPSDALALFDIALGGDLHGLRTRGKVALRAAEVAFVLSNPDRASGYLAIATSEPETREQARMEGLRHRPERAQATTLISAEMAESSVLTERGLGVAPQRSEPSRGNPEPPPDLLSRTLLSSGSIRAAAASASEFVQQGEARTAQRYSRQPAPLGESLGEPISSPPQSPVYDKPTPPSLANARPAVSGRYSVAPPAVEEVAPLQRGQSIRPQPVQSVSAPASLAHTQQSPSPIEIGQQPPSPRHADPLRQGGYFPAASAGESALFQALNSGSLEAGIELVKELENRTSRTQDLVMVCRRVAFLAPGEAWAVAKLHQAALSDRNSTYARAVEHVLAILTPGHPRIEPPALGDQVEQPDAVRAMLFRDSIGPVQEALAIVWEGAEHVFRRDASTYGVTGMERVPLSSSSPLGRVYAGAARALALTRTPLFQRRSAGAITVNLALLSPPAVILSGDVRSDTPELRFHLGAMLAASIPQYALLFGSPESQARAVLKGLGFAFGPPRQTKSGGVLNLAEVLWESIPARFQRRLRELCDHPEDLDYDGALAASRIAVRRAGLFVAGDLAVALNEAAADDGVSREQLRVPNALAELSRTAPSLRSLLTLALSPEYAETRWQFSPRLGNTRF